MTKALSQFIDAARWIAALAVLIGHSAVLISIPDIMVAPHGPGIYAWWFLSAFSHQAVVVFFVISGCLVGGSVLQRLNRPAPFLRNYAIDRFSRIYIVLGPVLVFGFLLDFVGRQIFPRSGVYDASYFAAVFDPANFFTALIQQQSFWAPQAGTNGPLWSLACEVWYYVTFPLLLLPFAKAYSAGARWAGFALGAVLTILMALPGVFWPVPGGYFMLGYAIWALGAMVATARRPLIRSKWLSLALFLAAATIIRLAVRGPFVEARPYLHYIADAVLAGSFANLLLTLRFLDGQGFAALESAAHRRLADFSYSLYASHGPIVFFFWAGAGALIGKDWFRTPATTAHWALAFALIATAVCVSYAISRATEARTDDLRRFLRVALDRPVRPREQISAIRLALGGGWVQKL